MNDDSTQAPARYSTVPLVVGAALFGGLCITAGALVFGSVGYLMSYSGLPDDGRLPFQLLVTTAVLFAAGWLVSRVIIEDVEVVV